MMEDIQNEYSITEYSVIQTTLEQIFNNFALMGNQRKDTRKNTLKRRSITARD